MHLFKQASSARTFLMFLCLFFLSSCIGGTKTEISRYFLIDPEITQPLSNSIGKILNIEIQDLQIPQYLQRFQIVTRSAENRLRLSEFNQWGESLRENLIRTMARNLSSALSSPNISTPVNRSSTTADHRIHIYIEQFEHDIDNKVKLSARWEIMSAIETDSPSIETFEASSKLDIEPDDYDSIVSSMQSLFADLSRAVAESILTQVQ